MTAALPDRRRAAAYGRISDDPDDRREGVDDQLARAQTFINRRGWDHVGTFRDDDISAYSGRPKPGYDALMAEVAAGRVDTVVVRHIDRLWRDDLEAATAGRVLRQHRVTISEYGGMEYDLSTAAGRRYARDAASGGTFESDIKSERVREAVERRAERGKMNGRCPYGWRREHQRTPGGKVIDSWEVIEPAEADVVRGITRRLLAGDSLHGITADLNARGVPSPGAELTFRVMNHAPGNPTGTRWNKNAVRRIALRACNAALRVFHQGRPDERLIDGDWPALVEKSEWQRVVTLLTAQAKPATAPTQEGKVLRRPANRVHLLTGGVGQCGRCGSPLRVARLGPAGKPKVPYYLCVNTHCGLGRHQGHVDLHVGDVVIERLSRPDALAWLAPDGRELAEATARATEARELLATAGVKLATGEWTVPTVDAVTAATRPKLEEAEADIRRLTTHTDHGVLIDMAGPEAGRRWNAASVNLRRAVLEALGMRVLIRPVGRKGPGFAPDSIEIVWRGQS